MSAQRTLVAIPSSELEPAPAAELHASLDRIVGRARAGADAFRALDQAAVDAIVWAMVVAGLESAMELAELAMNETGFGVLEDKVVKNSIATEFLYEYLKDKKSVGVIGEAPERGIQYLAEPIGVVLGVLPITNPASTRLFKAIVAAKTRNAIVFRPAARAARCGGARGGDPPRGRGAGRPPAGRVAGRAGPDAGELEVPVPPPRRGSHLGHRRKEDGRGGGLVGQAGAHRRSG